MNNYLFDMNNIIPTIDKKPCKAKPRYIKPDSVKRLESDFQEWKYKSLPNIPYQVKPKFRDDTANGLTDCLAKWCQINDAHFQRMNSQGQYDAKLKIWRRSGSTKGISDTLIIYRGQTIHIEIKVGKDKQSEAQKKMQVSVEASGGIYWVIKSFDQFINQINSL